MKPTNLKAGQRWVCTTDGEYFDVVEVDGRMLIRWNDSSSSCYVPEGGFIYDYTLDETYAVECLLKEYETE